jgi:hypothetical protein
MTCATRLGDAATGLLCTRLDDHDPHHGCTFESTSGQAHVPKEGI